MAFLGHYVHALHDLDCWTEGVLAKFILHNLHELVPGASMPHFVNLQPLLSIAIRM